MQASSDEALQLEAQVHSMRAELEECKQREAAWLTEKTSLQDRLRNLEVELEHQKQKYFASKEVVTLPGNCSGVPHATDEVRTCSNNYLGYN